MEQLSFIKTKKTRFDYKLKRYTKVNNIVVSRVYNVLETFAGAGGLGLGLEEAGFNTIGAIEIDKNATETLRINRPQWNVIEEDINVVVNNGVHRYINDEIDLLSGGYPCQSFSYAGLREGLTDTRGTLFYPFSQLIEAIKPKMFLAENVKGLVNHDNGKTLETMLSIFKRKGYVVYWNILNAWDYSVAQKRERIVIVGVRDDLVKQQKFSYSFPSPQEYKPVLRDVLKDVPESIGMKYSKKKYKILKLVPPGGSWVDLPEEIAREYLGASWHSSGGKRGMARRLSWDEPSLTLTTSPSQKQTERCHPDKTRPLTVREYSRIQGFPDDWEFAGGIGAQYKQIGNAVPINLGKFIGLSIIKYLEHLGDIDA